MRFPLPPVLLLGLASPAIAQLELTASDGASPNRFGWAVAVHGEHALVGAPYAEDSGPKSGAAYLYDVTTGKELLELVPSNGSSNDAFGDAVALDGTRALVGAPWKNSVYVFDVLTGQELFEIVGPNAGFGASVAISGDRAVIGGPSSPYGAAFVFDLTTGKKLFKLTASDRKIYHGFGTSVGISGDRVIVGASGFDGVPGSAYLFDVTTGLELFQLAPTGGHPYDGFGMSVGIHGHRAVVGAPTGSTPDGWTGTAHVFDVATGQELVELSASDGAFLDEFGAAVAICSERVIVGAAGHDDLGANSGSAYVFDLTTGRELVELTAPNGAPADLFGRSVSIRDGHALAGAPLDDDQGDMAGSAVLFGFAAAVGTNYCGPANANSLGIPGVIAAVGLEEVAYNELTLIGRRLPSRQTAMFLGSQTQGFSPFHQGSAGNLCLAGAIVLHVDQIGSTSGGATSAKIDLAGIPVVAGETWNWQCWYRDGGTSNFTDGISISFR